MAEYAALPIFIDAWALDCAHLSDAEDGRYFRLCRLMWAQPLCRIPNDDEWIARKLGRTAEDVARDVRPIIMEFCTTTGNWITQKRLRKEWHYVRRKVESRRASAKARWDKGKIDANALREHTTSHAVRNAPSPSPSPSLRSSSVPNGTAPDGAVDLKAAIFDSGLRWLAATSKRSDASCRSLLGKWLGIHGDEAVLAVLASAQRQGAIEPVSWIEAAFRERSPPKGRKAEFN